MPTDDRAPSTTPPRLDLEVGPLAEALDAIDRAMADIETAKAALVARRHDFARVFREQVQAHADDDTLGEDYVACDPRDRAEIVIPLGPDVGTADRVLDLDSFDLDGFSDVDDRRLRTLLRLAGFTPIEAGPPLRSISTED